MPRSKSSVTHKARVKKVLSQAKGYYGKRKNIFRIAKQSVVRSGAFALAHRRKKKGDFRKIWAIRINAALAPHGLKYSQFIHSLEKAGIQLNRKSLAYLATTDENAFKAVLETVNK